MAPSRTRAGPEPDHRGSKAATPGRMTNVEASGCGPEDAEAVPALTAAKFQLSTAPEES